MPATGWYLPLTGGNLRGNVTADAGVTVDTLDLSLHAHTGAAGHGVQISHASLTNVTANQHHAQAHLIDGADHTAAGLTIGHVLTATGATTFAFQAVAGVSLDGLSDVVITTPADNEVLAYDSGSATWINQTAAEAGLSVVGHGHASTDVSDFAEAVDDRAAALIQNGTGLAWTYDDVANTLTGNVSVTQYTDEMAQDAVGGMLLDTATVNLTYTDATPSFSADAITQMSVTSDASGLKLSGDSAAPGNTQLYGTDGAGVKGWYAQPAAGATDHGALTGLVPDDDHTQYLLAAGTRGLSAAWDAGSWQIRAETFQSDVATGTAPFTVASTTAVTNLNADLLDGLEAAAFAVAAKGVTNGDGHDHSGGDGAAIVEAAITLADNTTNNASTARHGFLLKLSNVATEYMNGQGGWTVPAGTAPPSMRGMSDHMSVASFWSAVTSAGGAGGVATYTQGVTGSALTVKGGNAVGSYAYIQNNVWNLYPCFTDEPDFASLVDLTAPAGPNGTEGYWGMGNVSASATGMTLTSDHAGFRVFYNNTTGTLYATNADGTTETSNSIAGLTLTSGNLYYCKVDVGVNCKYYTNGTLQQTQTGNLPRAGQLVPYATYAAQQDTHATPTNIMVNIRFYQQCWEVDA